MKILIVTNRPIEEYQILCVKTIKRYCVVNDIDFGFVDEYKYNKKYDYVVYMDNSNLIINLLVDIESYIDNKYDLIHLGYSEGIQSKNKFIIIKNNKLYDTVNNVDILKQKITVDKVLVIDHIINLNENNKYSNNDSLENEKFLNDIKRDKMFFYTTNMNVLPELKNHVYYQVFNKIYNNKKFLDINIVYDKYKYDDDSEVFNPGKNIAFVTLYTKQIKDEGVEMEYSLKEYCEKNNYTCYIHRKSELEGKRHPTLEKPYLLKKYLDKHKYVIWIDSDILMFDQKHKIESVIVEKYDFTAFIDPNPINLFNAGFLIFKCNQTASDILDRWIYEIETQDITTIHGPTRGDQGLINDIIRNEYRNNSLIYGNDEINCEISNYKIKDIKIVHLMGVYGFIRPLLMKYLNYLTFIVNKPFYIVDQQYPHLGGSIGGGDLGTWSSELWDFLISDLSIKSMIDVGCGEGLSTKYFKNKNIDVLGIEGLQESINRSKIKESIILHDYTKGKVIVDKNYDLCWCCEFVEHIEEQFVDNFIDTFKKSKYLTMTHADIGQLGHHHVNCQNDKYWIDLLEKNNFKYDEEYSIKLRNITNDNAIHIKRSLLFFENKNIN